MDRLPLTACALRDLGNVEARYLRGELRTGHSLLVICLEGALTGTSPNEFDAFDLASALIVAGLEAWQPWAAILDLQGIAYEWGDRLQNVLLAPRRWSEAVQPIRNALTEQAADREFPYRVIASGTNRFPISSLITEQLCCEPDTLLCNTLDEGIESLEMTLNGVSLV
jgi:hypothetical protein